MKQIEKMVEKKKVVPSAYYIQKWYQEIVDGNFDSSERLSKKGLLLIKRWNTTNLQDLSALYNNLCRAQTKQWKPEEALINCDLSIESNSSNAAAYDSRAVLYMGMWNYDKALLDIEKGLLMVEDYRFYDTKALIYDAMGKTNEAKTAREKSKAMQN